MDRALKVRLLPRKGFAQMAVKFGIARLPYFVADVNASEINIAVAEAQQRLSRSFLHVVNSSAFFLLVGMTCIKDNSVASLQRSFEIDSYATAFNTPHFGRPNGLSWLGLDSIVPDAPRVGEIRSLRTPMRIYQFGLKLYF